MLFPLTRNKTPPQINSPLSVQEGFEISSFENTTCSPFRIQRDTKFEIFQSIENYMLKLGWWCGPFALGSYFLPLWHESPKTESLEPLNDYFLPFGK